MPERPDRPIAVPTPKDKAKFVEERRKTIQRFIFDHYADFPNFDFEYVFGLVNQMTLRHSVVIADVQTGKLPYLLIFGIITFVDPQTTEMNRVHRATNPSGEMSGWYIDTTPVPSKAVFHGGSNRVALVVLRDNGTHKPVGMELHR